jgi:hypothetical protein
LLKLLNEVVLPKAEYKAPQSVDKIITGFVKLMCIMIEMQAKYVNKLLIEAEGDPLSGTLLRVINAMKVWNPNDQPTKLLP